MESSGNGDKVLDMLKKKAALVQAEIERIEGSGPFEQDFSGASKLLDHLREVTGVLGGWTREGEILVSLLNMSEKIAGIADDEWCR